MPEKKICIIGGGNMGEALTGGIISSGLARAEDITIHDIEKERLAYFRDKYHVCVSADIAGAIETSDIVILAVKPRNMETVLGDIADAVADRLVISIAAGITLGFMEERLGGNARAIRVMPNTPALIGEGAAALAGGKNATDSDIATARRIFDSVGITVVVKEELIDAVTGLSGSGPAYGFIIIDALANAGVSQGLEAGTALKLAAQTMLGAAKLCLNGDKTPAQLTDMVTSPGGTTIEGIKALKAGKIREALAAAVEAATKKSKELGEK
ncbi:MAG: pyrroline-5-carboxylate reductase [Deltaproteobacteria bacterium]|nr:pyrroline-5-carboxylate reductase [Deltaproteobacteria bacterium]MBW2595401.1 pyrroline-5-carboxylate reductase [Deltaproteobacteria bacterium]